MGAGLGRLTALTMAPKSLEQQEILQLATCIELARGFRSRFL